MQSDFKIKLTFVREVQNACRLGNNEHCYYMPVESTTFNNAGSFNNQKIFLSMYWYISYQFLNFLKTVEKWFFKTAERRLLLIWASSWMLFSAFGRIQKNSFKVTIIFASLRPISELSENCCKMIFKIAQRWFLLMWACSWMWFSAFPRI
jgi:hypothetical protein